MSQPQQPKAAPTPTNTIDNSLAAILNNYAVCREHIGGEEYMKSGDFEAHMMMCFGGHDKSKRPIDDLTSKAVAAINKTIMEARADELEGVARANAFTNNDHDHNLIAKHIVERKAELKKYGRAD